MNHPDLGGRFVEQGLDALLMSPDSFVKLIADDTVRYTKVVKESGVKVN